MDIRKPDQMLHPPAVAMTDASGRPASLCGIATAELVDAGAAGETGHAIRPYPAELEQELPLRDGRHVLVRPIRPEDEAALRRFYEMASQEDMRLRFFSQRGVPGPAELARYTQIDYDREMAFVAFDVQDGAQRDLLGYACASSAPDPAQAEFAVQICTPAKGVGLATGLLRCLIRYLRARGTQALVGECLGENIAMAALAGSLGFETRHREGQVQMRLALQEPAAIRTVPTE